MPAAESGNFPKWFLSLSERSKLEQSNLLTDEITKRLQSSDKKDDLDYTARKAAEGFLEESHKKFDSQKTQLKEKITATLDGLKNQPDIMFSHLTFSNVSQKFYEFNQLELNSNSSSSANQLTNLYGLIKSIHDAKASLPKSKNKTLNELEENIKKYARVKLWCDTKDSMAPAAAASANPNPDQEKFFEQLETQRHGLTSTANVLHHAEESMKNTLQETFRTDSSEARVATAASTMLQIAKEMDKEREEKYTEINKGYETLQGNLSILNKRTQTAFDNIQSEIDALQKKINDPSVTDATQKQIAQKRIPKLEGLKTEIETIHNEIDKVTQKPFEELSKKINDLDKQKNPVLFKGELTATQVAMRDSENALKQAQKSILNTTNERLYNAVMPFSENKVASIFQNTAENIAIPEAKQVLKELTTATIQVQEQCKMLLTLKSKMITKEAREFYHEEYRDTLNLMSKSLDNIAIQVNAQYQTLNHACKQDASKIEVFATAFEELRRLDDAVVEQQKRMMSMFEFAKTALTEKRGTRASKDGVDRPLISNPAANPDTVSGEDLGRGFEIYHYQRTNEYDKTSPLEKTYKKDKNGNHLNLSIKEIEQLVNTINQERSKDGKALLKLKITDKGNNRYAFTIDCHDKETKMQALNKMAEVQNKRIEALEKQNTASVKTANTPGVGTASKTEGAFQPFSGTGHTLRDSTATTPTPSPATPAASANPTPTVLPPRASGLPDPQDVRREIMNRAAKQRYATQIADAKREMPGPTGG